MKRILTPFLLATAWFTTQLSCHAACNVLTGGHVVDHYISDRVLHRRWAVIADCVHPDRPWIAEETPWIEQAIGGPQASMPLSAGPALKVAPLIVAAGAKVVIWKDAGGARIRLTGTALEPGHEGELIRIRTEKDPNTVLEGKVTGVGLVELARPVRWNAQ
ncbi:MAG TPA: flagella basal body P-ring formation protein FlgA [Pseudacidobacterium sp.]|nr:flagella basal body P-ring formation protein FlgA [Pseudacidobacterium sp.]